LVADPRAGRGPPPGRPPAGGGRSGAAQPPPRPCPPPPVRGGGWGGGQSPTAAPQILASDTAPIPAFPRMRGKEQGCPAASTPVAPLPPSAVEGWGGGKVRPLRRKSSRPTPPPPRPSPPCGGRSRARPSASPLVARPPPSAVERLGAGNVRPLRRKPSRPPPPPSRPSPACGGRSRACPAASTPVPPSPARGGGLRWGQSPTAAPQVLAS